MTRTRAGRPYHIGLTPEAIIDVALEATRDAGLESWSVRDLARRLGVATASLYHHVGGQELLRRRVVERVLTMVGFPTRVLPWREWFRAALFPARPVLAGHPGTARWLLLHGPAFPAMIPVVDAGIASLQRAGFGADTAKTYAALFNTALMTIASADDRAAHTRSAGRDHEALMDEFEALGRESPGISLLTRDLAGRLTGSAESAASVQDEYYRFVLERLMDGLEGLTPSQR